MTTGRRWQRALEIVLAPFMLFGIAHADPVAESLGDGIVRFWPDSAASSGALPSIAFASPPVVRGPAPEGFAVQPRFSMEAGARVARIAAPRGTTFYGTGEVAGTLARNGKTTLCWNTDAYGYGAASRSLYQSHPWVLAVRPDGSSFGVLADTPGRIAIDLTNGIAFRMQGPAYPVVVIERRTPQEVVSALSELVGRTPLPPRWAIGFQQCRYSYAPDTEVVRVAREFRRRGLPCDVLWMDIDYMDAHKPFTFDPVGFSAPRALADTLHARGFRSVWILDPGIKEQPGDPVYESGTAGDHWVKMPDGTPFRGRVWPGGCVFPDFTRAATRAWWSQHVGEFAERANADGIWNDMNEPAVFEVEGKTMPDLARHDADAALGGPGYHSYYHNVYGMLMARASWEGLHAARPDRRPFVLSRANYMCGNRWAAAWTGDNRANDEHLGWTLAMALNLGLSGQPFAGADIGGFAGALSGDDFAKWMGLGALLPFSRAHAEKGNIRKEPWSFGPRVEAVCKRALETRYRLLPYLYTAFEEASRTGLPVARPAFFADPAAEWLRTVEHEFLLGGDVLVDLTFDPAWANARRLSDDHAAWRAVTVVPGEPDVALPGLSVRAGAIVPLGPVMAYSDEHSLDEVELLVAPDAHGHAEGTLYEDAGDGYGYQHGQFRRTRFVAETRGAVVRVKLAGAEGAWNPPASRRYRVTLAGAANGMRAEGP